MKRETSLQVADMEMGDGGGQEAKS